MTPRRLRLAALLLVPILAVGCGDTAREGSMEETTFDAADDTAPRVEYGMVIHGGAGTITRESMTPELEQQYRTRMEEALRAGHEVLAGGGPALDAVEATLRLLEDSELFNAGRGAVFTADGTNALDASIMDGATLRAGAVAGVSTVRNPITLARYVMERSPHVMLSGTGAEQFAREQGIEVTPADYFRTDRRWQQLQEAQEAERAAQAGGAGMASGRAPATWKYGTVGAAALDQAGNLAAGTTTGGMTNKKWGRIGDSPVIGAGTYANASCALSATGWGEYFIRNVVAYDICARAEYLEVPLPEAARQVIMEKLEAQEPETGGIIGLDSQGRVVMAFNSQGMYRGWVDQDGNVTVAIYRDP
ncbi:MAG: isoaspartyl peptidase/L-asparaginase [Gemmatimonadota bacterium]